MKSRCMRISTCGVSLRSGVLRKKKMWRERRMKMDAALHVREVVVVREEKENERGECCVVEGVRRKGRRQRRSVICSGMGSAVVNAAQSLSQHVEAAPPSAHLAYLLLAGVGVPLSEDALCISCGANLSRVAAADGMNAAVGKALEVVPILWIGVILSDLITFAIGAALKRGFMRGLLKFIERDEKLLTRATNMISRWGLGIGGVQRFAIGFRGPVCLIAGLTGVDVSRFAAGAAAGACITLPLQLAVGHALRSSQAPYIAALALVATPNAIGHVIGPIAAMLGIWSARQRAAASFSRREPDRDETVDVHNPTG